MFEIGDIVQPFGPGNITPGHWNDYTIKLIVEGFKGKLIVCREISSPPDYAVEVCYTLDENEIRVVDNLQTRLKRL